MTEPTNPPSTPGPTPETIARYLCDHELVKMSNYQSVLSALREML